MLLVYDAVVANQTLEKAERIPLWAVGERLKLVPSAMPHKWDNTYDRTSKHAKMSMTVSRFFSQARLIIANTVKGQFPNNDS